MSPHIPDQLLTSCDHVIFITGGGTSVPLEKKTVRSIENFSTGGRASRLAEGWLTTEGAEKVLIISLQRRGAVQVGGEALRDAVQWDGRGTSEEVEARIAAVAAGLRQRAQARSSDRWYPVYFDSVHEYLQLLEEIAVELEATHSGQYAIVLAAAVSDFYVKDVADDKIQSRGSSGLDLHLVATPKAVRPLVDKWAPSAVVVTFKLETATDTFLLEKARRALADYGHTLVVANLLQSYTHRVHLVRSTDASVLPEILEAGEGTTHLDREMLAPRLLDIFQEHWRGEGGIKRKRDV
jgi:phosphopantothenate-cysteine ligase